MIWFLIDVVYDVKRNGLDYEEKFEVLLEVLLELGKELKDYYVKKSYNGWD